jgi:hypothetical protein
MKFLLFSKDDIIFDNVINICTIKSTFNYFSNKKSLRMLVNLYLSNQNLKIAISTAVNFLKNKIFI